MINDEANNCYYFAVNKLSELDSSGWLRAKREAIINGDADFEDALNGALNYQTTVKKPTKSIKIKALY